MNWRSILSTSTSTSIGGSFVTTSTPNKQRLGCFTDTQANIGVGFVYTVTLTMGYRLELPQVFCLSIFGSLGSAHTCKSLEFVLSVLIEREIIPLLSKVYINEISHKRYTRYNLFKKKYNLLIIFWNKHLVKISKTIYLNKSKINAYILKYAGELIPTTLHLQKTKPFFRDKLNYNHVIHTNRNFTKHVKQNIKDNKRSHINSL